MSNVFVIHGVDHKVGTTMLTQSIAELISNAFPDLKILLLFLNGRKSTDYIKEEAGSIENIKLRIDNKMINGSEIKSHCLQKGNLFVLAGVGKIEDERYYHPENSNYLLKEITNDFDAIIVDSGNNLDSGLAIGALQFTDNRILVMTQQETSIKRYEDLSKTYELLGFSFKKFIINKYFTNDPYDVDYITKRTGAHKDDIEVIGQNNYYREAEASAKSLLEFKDENYKADIHKISNYILEEIGLDQIMSRKRQKRWKSFS